MNRTSTRAWPLILALPFLACHQSTPADSTAAEKPPAVKTLVDTSAGIIMNFEGIDVSHFQGTIDWTKVRASGKAFAFAKATEGVDLVDPTFSTNWAAMREAGIVRGAYHFFEPDDDAEAQANLFIATVELAPGDLPPALDVEVSDGESAAAIEAEVLTWLKAIHAHYGVKPILYSDVTFLQRDLADGFDTYPLWIADYSETAPTSIDSWTKWSFWQYSQDGSVAGIEGKVDLDRYAGTSREWSAMLVPQN